MTTKNNKTKTQQYRQRKSCSQSEKGIYYTKKKRPSITSCFSSKTIQARRKWNEKFEVLGVSKNPVTQNSMSMEIILEVKEK